MYDKVIEETEKLVEKILEQGLQDSNNLEYLYKLLDINKDAHKIKCMKEEMEMYGEYGNYSGRRAGYDSYGRGNYGEGSYGEYGRGGNYGRRGRDAKYRGDDELERMSGEYGRYQESRRYGAAEEADKSFHYMVKALEDFIKVLQEEAEAPQQKQMLNETLQRSIR